MRYCFNIRIFLGVLIVVIMTGAHATGYAAELDAGLKATDTTVATTSPKESSPSGLKVQEVKAKEELKQKKIEVETAKEEVVKVILEKQTIDKEAKLKEQEAIIVDKEIEVIKKEAEITKDPEAAKKIKELTQKSEQLNKEAELYREKQSLMEAKTQAAQQIIDANKTAIEDLKSQLQGIRREKITGRSLVEKTKAAGWIIIIGIVLWFLISYALKITEKIITKTEKDEIRESEITLRLKTLIKICNWAVNIFIFMSVVYLLLENFGVSVAPLIASAGIFGLAFGFGGQYLIRDMINGFFIFAEEQYRINDVVQIAGFSGLVKDINLRITTLKDLEGRVIYVPNGEIKTVVNFTREHSRALLEIGVAYKENVDQVMDVIKQIGAEMRKDRYFKRLIVEDLEMLGVEAFADSQITIKFRIKTRPIKQWEVARELRRRIKNKFDELGIEIPFPHRTLYWGTGANNQLNLSESAKISKETSSES